MGGTGGTQIVVTGLGRVMGKAGSGGVITGPGNKLFKTITGMGGRPSSAPAYDSPAAAIAGNIIKTVSKTDLNIFI